MEYLYLIYVFLLDSLSPDKIFEIFLPNILSVVIYKKYVT